MSMFRVVVILAALSLIGLATVYLRWSNAHHAYQIARQYDRHRHLTSRYHLKRLELASRQTPEQLLEQLQKWDFKLDGWTTPQTRPSPTHR